MIYNDYNIIGRTGEVIARNLVHLPETTLVCGLCNIPMLPRGTFAYSKDIEGYATRMEENELWLNIDDLIGLTADGSGKGCCGPDGADPNLVAADGTPSAIEFSDCWGASYARIPAGWFSIEAAEASEQPPVVLVGVASFNDRERILERAVGLTRKVAEKRLIDAARRMAEFWTNTKPKAHALFDRMKIMELADSRAIFQEGWRGWVTNKPC